MRIKPSAISLGDKVIAIGLSTPDRALAFDATRIIDEDLGPITETATVDSVDPYDDQFVIELPNGHIQIVNVNRTTKIFLQQGSGVLRSGVLADMQPGSTLTVSGLLNGGRSSLTNVKRITVQVLPASSVTP